jgi:RNA 2',3'-cyclic 3'-phosphodiesterase
LAASVGGDERLRLFFAYRLPGGVADALADWQARELRDGRIVPPENLHATLVFLGGRPAGDLPAILRVLERAAGESAPPVLELDGWRETRSAGMLVFADRTGHGAAFAGTLQGELGALGVHRPERRPWLPHVTVLRYRERPRLRPPLPELGAFAPSDAAAFLSRLHPSGARYEVLESFSLGG